MTADEWVAEMMACAPELSAAQAETLTAMLTPAPDLPQPRTESTPELIR